MIAADRCRTAPLRVARAHHVDFLLPRWEVTYMYATFHLQARGHISTCVPYVVQVGQPYLEGVRVEAEVVEELKGEKVRRRVERAALSSHVHLGERAADMKILQDMLHTIERKKKKNGKRGWPEGELDRCPRVPTDPFAGHHLQDESQEALQEEVGPVAKLC